MKLNITYQGMNSPTIYQCVPLATALANRHKPGFKCFHYTHIPVHPYGVSTIIVMFTPDELVTLT